MFCSILRSSTRHRRRLGIALPTIARSAPQQRNLSKTRRLAKELINPAAISAYLNESSWSVHSLLPPSPSNPLDAAPATTFPPSVDDADPITESQLLHLLRLCALPPPSSPAESARMLCDLQAQLHFVRHIQRIDTVGVAPLQRLRDESPEAEQEAEIGLEDPAIKEAMANERVVGRWMQRIRRAPESHERAAAAVGQGGFEQEYTDEMDGWDVLGNAERTKGRYFVVEGPGSEKGDVG